MPAKLNETRSSHLGQKILCTHKSALIKFDECLQQNRFARLFQPDIKTIKQVVLLPRHRLKIPGYSFAPLETFYKNNTNTNFSGTIVFTGLHKFIDISHTGLFSTCFNGTNEQIGKVNSPSKRQPTWVISLPNRLTYEEVASQPFLNEFLFHEIAPFLTMSASSH